MTNVFDRKPIACGGFMETFIDKMHPNHYRWVRIFIEENDENPFVIIPEEYFGQFLKATNFKTELENRRSGKRYQIKYTLEQSGYLYFQIENGDLENILCYQKINTTTPCGINCASAEYDPIKNIFRCSKLPNMEKRLTVIDSE